MDRGFLRLSAAVLAIASAAACAPVQTYSGFRADRNNVEITEPQVGVDTRDTIVQRFGTPSTTAVFDQTAWYYVSSVQEQVAFYTPRITERQVMVVHFDGETVAGIERYGVERGRIVNYDSHATPTRGRELGVLEQIFGNIGNTAPIRPSEEEDNPRRR
jgi:outer membrane protein assembly factor BamE (lipoprotein component of BamABCDE complex)